MKSNAAVLEMPALAKPEREKPRRARGSGSVYWRGKDKDHGCWWVKFYIRGREVRESAHSDKKMVAEELLRRRLVEVQDGNVAPERIRYEQMRDALYEDYETRGHKSLLKKSDGTRYVGTVPALDEFFAGYRAEAITTQLMKEFIRKRQQAGISNSGINGSLAALSRMFWLQVQESRFPRSLVPHFPMLKKDNPRTDFFTLDEYERLLKELRPDLRPLLTVGFYTGARRGELLKLRWADVDLKAGTLLFRNTKNDEDRLVPLTNEAKKALEKLRAAHPESEFVFVREDGKPVKDFRRAWDGAKERAGLAVKERKFHGLRRGVTTNLAEAGVPEQIAMAYTGHKDIATHRRYRQLMQTNLLQAAKRLQAHVTGKNGHSLGTTEKGAKRRARK